MIVLIWVFHDDSAIVVVAAMANDIGEDNGERMVATVTFVTPYFI